MQHVNSSKKCFIFGALPVDDMPLSPSPGDIVIAADKGVLNTAKLGLKADLVIGDFDSLGTVPNGKNTVVLPVKKDHTDIGYAINLALGKVAPGCDAKASAGCVLPDFTGVDTIVIYGGIGSLLDHTLANLQLAAYISEQGVNPLLFGEGMVATAVHDSSVTFPPAEGRISVLCTGSAAKGVTIKNLEYELSGATLSPTYPLGVSNAFRGREAEISVKSGTLIIVWQGQTVPTFG